MSGGEGGGLYKMSLVCLGVRLYEGVSVEGVIVADGRVAGVKTSKGNIECEKFINCTGQVCIEQEVCILYVCT